MKRKIFFTYAILLIIGTILTGLLSLSFIKIDFLDNIENMLVTNGNLINTMIQQETNKKEPINYHKLSKELSKSIDARITFIDKSGVVIGDSDVQDLSMVENHRSRKEVEEALRGEIGKSERISKTVNIDYLYVAIPWINGENQVMGITRLAYPLTEIEKINSILIRSIIFSVLIGLIVAIPLGFRYLNHITKPIKEITVKIKKIADGNFKERVYIDSTDEIRILADTFNFMSDTVDRNMTELMDYNTKIKSILSSMEEGLIAVDNTNNIILANKSANKLFDILPENIIGMKPWDVIDDEILRDLFIDILEKRDSRSFEVVLNEGNKIIKLYSEIINHAQDPNRRIGMLILGMDVTEMRKLEIMRTDFVANVSHELRTPLTSISGFVETLRNGAAEDANTRNRFLDIISIEADRLSRLIEDLLTLSHIEGRDMSSTGEADIDINSRIKDVISMLDELAKKKNIRISIEESHLPSILGNDDWFKQLMVNIIDNGIKYTQSGGRVDIRTKYDKDSNQIVVEVEDNGIGIPKEDIPRLFERFYRVDKARSRKVGGTGLGLAISKHIVLSFNGNITVKSKEGIGTKFIIRLPIN